MSAAPASGDPDVAADPPVNSDCDRRARAWLSRAAEPGSRAVHGILAELGAPDAARAIRAGTAPAAVLAEVGARASADTAERDLEAADRLGIRFVIPGDTEWPEAAVAVLEQAFEADRRAGRTWKAREELENCVVPPVGLWLRGPAPLPSLLDRAVSIVGSRAATAYGEHMATDLAHGLALADWTVVSGGAYGIDVAAHRGALAAEGCTVAVLACGLDRPYPRSNAVVFDRILQSGLLVSEHPVGSAPLRHRFLIRNRLIAAMSAGTVVVEAAARSGAQATARRAARLGRALMAVPGPATSATSTGTHQLIRDVGARLVTRTAEVVEEVGRIGADLTSPERGPVHARDDLGLTATRVLDALPVNRPAPLERIALVAGVLPSDALRTLALLEMRELAESGGGGWRLAASLRRARHHGSGSDVPGHR